MLIKWIGCCYAALLLGINMPIGKEVMPMPRDSDEKKLWTSPELITYGTVEELTQQPKLKTPGTSDDFQITGISDA
jgi:hypothetical protein